MDDLGAETIGSFLTHGVPQAKNPGPEDLASSPPPVRGKEVRSGVSYLFRSKQRSQDLAGSANPHLISPILLDLALTDCSVNKPTELSCTELPGWTLLLTFGGTSLNNPARLSAFVGPSHPGDQEKDLPLNMSRHRPPPLFIAMYSLDRRAKQLGHLNLGLLKPLTEV
jgi:hypothetical protein